MKKSVAPPGSKPRIYISPNTQLIFVINKGPRSAAFGVHRSIISETYTAGFIEILALTVSA